MRPLPYWDERRRVFFLIPSELNHSLSRPKTPNHFLCSCFLCVHHRSALFLSVCFLCFRACFRLLACSVFCLSVFLLSLGPIFAFVLALLSVPPICVLNFSWLFLTFVLPIRFTSQPLFTFFCSCVFLVLCSPSFSPSFHSQPL